MKKFKAILTGILMVNVILVFSACSLCGDKKKSVEKKTTNDTSFFAINGGKPIHTPDELDTTVKKRIEWMHELGVNWDRSDLWWSIVEPVKGEFDFSVTDKIVDFYRENNVEIYPILSYGAKWWDGRNCPTNSEEVDEYVNYVSKIVERYKDDFKYWSVWNEPNITTFWSTGPNPELYAELLKKTYTTIKEIDPDAVVCAPALAPLGAWDSKFMEVLYQNGCKDYFDVLDYHYYREGDPEIDVATEIDNIRAVMHKYGDAKPIWLSEMGVVGDISNITESYQDQASLLARNILICLASGIEKIFYFDLQNWNDDIDSSWDSKLGIVEASGEKKPAFFVYQNLVKQLDHKKIIGPGNLADGSIESVLYYDEENEEYSLVVWSLEQDLNKNVKVYCKDEKVVITDVFGKEEEMTASNDEDFKSINIKVDRFPKYIKNIDPVKYLPEFGVKLDYPIVILANGEEIELQVVTSPLLNAKNLEIVDLQAPEGIKYDSDTKLLTVSDYVSPGKHKVIFNIVYEYDIDGKTGIKKVERTAIVDVVTAMSLSVRPYLNDKNVIEVKTTLTNNMSKDIIGKIELYQDVDGAARRIGVSDEITAKSGQAVIAEIKIDNEILNSYNGEVKWYGKFANIESPPFMIYTVELLDKAPVIDGNLDDWKDIPSLKINKELMLAAGKNSWSEEKASADVKVALTEDSVCFAANVIDNDPMINNCTPPQLWNGDSFELYLSFMGPSTQTILDKSCEFQLGIIPTYGEGEAPMVFMYHFDKVLSDSEIVATKTDTGYLVEARIPFTDLSNVSIENMKYIGLDVSLRDIDENEWVPEGNTPGRTLIWGGGQNTSNWINPSGWSMGIIKSKQ